MIFQKGSLALLWSFAARWRDPYGYHVSVCSSVFVSSQQRFGVTDIKAPSACHSSWVLDRSCYSSQVSNGPCYSSQTNQCYSSILFRRQQENPSLRCEGTSIQRHEKSAPARRVVVVGSQLWLLYLDVSLSLGLSYVNWASQECCLFYLRSSLRSSDLLLFHFCGLFPSLSGSHRHFGLLFPVLPNSARAQDSAHRGSNFHAKLVCSGCVSIVPAKPCVTFEWMLRTPKERRGAQ